jgi:hypothetical protein
LNVYRWFLETFYGLKISDMYIMIFHPDNTNYKRFKLNRLETEVDDMLAARLKAVRDGKGKTVSFAETVAVVGSSAEYGFTD